MSLAIAQTPDPSTTLTKALLRAGGILGLSQAELGAIIGLSSASMSRLARGDARLTGKPLELAMLVIRLYRSLDAIVGGDDRASQSWLRVPNSALDGALPITMMRNIPGLLDVVAYVDARRALV